MQRIPFLTAIAAVSVAAAASATPAHAATVESLETVAFTADANEANDVSVTSTDGQRFTIRDDRAVLTAGVGCVSSSSHVATCTRMPGGGLAVTFALGAGDDKLDLSKMQLASAVVDAGDGDDVVAGSPRSDEIDGEDGSDTLDGGAGNDTLVGRAGADRLTGGTGSDAADYSARTNPLRLIIDGTATSGNADDGPIGARDQIDKSIEKLRGGRGDDVLTGDVSDNVLDGGPGADVLNGAGGEDVADYSLRVHAVRATIDEAPGSGDSDDGPAGARDTIAKDVEDIWGGAGDDVLTGDGGRNLLNGGPGADTLSGGAGEDAADYSERSEGVVAVADGKPTSGNEGDGPTGARDTVEPDVEDLIGGRGNDRLTGNSARNWLGGEAGDDLLDVRGQGSDYASCGPGNDTAWVDPPDIGSSDCEQIRPGPTGTDPAPLQMRVRLARGQSLRTFARRGLSLLFTCSESCAVEARLLLGDAIVARTYSQREAAGGARITLRPSRSRRLGLGRRGRVDLALLLSGQDADGNATELRRHATLLPSRARLLKPGQSPHPPFTKPRPHPR